MTINELNKLIINDSFLEYGDCSYNKGECSKMISFEQLTKATIGVSVTRERNRKFCYGCDKEREQFFCLSGMGESRKGELRMRCRECIVDDNNGCIKLDEKEIFTIKILHGL